VAKEPDHHQVWVVSVQGPDEGTPVQQLPALETAAEDPVGGDAERDGRGKDCFKRDILMDKRCPLGGFEDSLHSTEVVRRMGPDRARGEAQSETPERKKRGAE